MARPKTNGPTDKELDILNVLWKRGPSTVRQVHETMGRQETTGYTTTLKLMQIMTEKGLLERNTSTKIHIYMPVHKQEEVQKQIIGNVLNQVFSGSTDKLVIHALTFKDVSMDEMERIKRFIEEYENKRDSVPGRVDRD